MKASTILINILVISSLIMTMSCNEEEQHRQTVRTIMATIEHPSTRTALDGPDADGVYKTVWSSNDEIAVLSGNGEAVKFKLKSGANTNTAEFEGSIASDDMVSIYPYSIVIGNDGSVVSVDLPEIQEYASDNIPADSYPMAAICDDAMLSFKNLCSVLKLKMFGDLTVKSITFTPNDNNIRVSGKASVNISSNELVMDSDAKASVKLNCPNGVKLSDASTDFHMIVPAQKYSGGFTITISTDQGDVVKAVKSDVTLSRSVLYPIKAFECKIDHSKDNIVFEDANFKTYMVANFDTDNDGEISLKEALNVTKIEVNTDNITSLVGIEYMTNLQDLCCHGSYYFNSSTQEYDIYGALESLDVSKNTKLSCLRITGNKLTSLDVKNNPELEDLNCSSNNLSSLEVKNDPKLQTLDCSNNNLSSLDICNMPKLRSLVCTSNNLSSLNVKNNMELQWLHCFFNNLSSLDLSNNPKLRGLDCDRNNLQSLNVNNNPELTYLNCCRNDLSSLDIKNNSKLKELHCGNNNLSSLDVSNNQKLEQLYCNKNKIPSLDISNNTAMKLLWATDNPLATLFIYKGQTNSITDLRIPSTTKIVVKGSEDPDEPEDWTGKEFWHKSLAMKFSSSYCANCPSVTTVLESVMSQYPYKVEVLNLHKRDSDYAFSETDKLISELNISGYIPHGIIDCRRAIDNYASDYLRELIVNSLKETEDNYPTKTGISFSSSISGSELSLNIKLFIKEKGDYKVTAVLLEDNIIGFQLCGSIDYNHKDVARVAITDITGDAVTTSEDNKTVSKNYTATIPSSCDKNNLRVLVYVLKQYGSQTIIRTADYGDYYVDNAVSAAIGTTQDLVFSDGTIYGGNEGMKDGGEITLK